MKLFKLGIIFLLSFNFSSSFAAVGARSGLIDFIEMDSSQRVGLENFAYIAIVGNPAWSATACNVNLAYFNASTNPHFVALALSAQASNKSIQVQVDDSLPITGTTCQIINLKLN